MIPNYLNTSSVVLALVDCILGSGEIPYLSSIEFFDKEAFIYIHEENRHIAIYVENDGISMSIEMKDDNKWEEADSEHFSNFSDPLIFKNVIEKVKEWQQ